MCLCGDYKVTVNPVLEADQYLLPKPENLFIALTGGDTFFKLDLKESYKKVLFEEESCKFLSINTHQRLYRYIRVPFGISSAPNMFQKVMDRLPQGTNGAIRFVDDILITGQDHKQYLNNLA